MGQSVKDHKFPEQQLAGVYRAIYQRRDMRHFVPGAVDSEVLRRILQAAHAAPSVGLMQPWRFIRISDSGIRQQIHQLVERERQQTADAMAERKDEFMRLKVEGILDCGELLVVALGDQPQRYVFGRRTLPEMDLASASCAIQNMWLAARAEGLGVGWVSIFAPDELAKLLNLPADSKAIAILCIGHVDKFYDEPMLIEEGWAKAAPLEDLVMENGWEVEKGERAHLRD